ncbi:unnamed protein product [Medioppia subpectinata]|uniref:Uncharacterized protein n=1 Tax=Medioppia subpectinata TaxID=1979941 RepID=A0A7R9KSS0_9ACAR|nr:unnamed protein product [Medioppia subpectinata]CAG2109118.1 unnamed protein product [Medioppia subpectinata]
MSEGKNNIQYTIKKKISSQQSLATLMIREGEESRHGFAGTLILLISLFCIACTLPLSLFICLKLTDIN